MDTKFKFLEKIINKNGVNILDTSIYKKNLTGHTLNVTGKDVHVSGPERMICTIKDGARCTKASLPMFKKFPQRFIVKIVAAVILFYNCSIPVWAPLQQSHLERL